MAEGLANMNQYPIMRRQVTLGSDHLQPRVAVPDGGGGRGGEWILLQ